MAPTPQPPIQYDRYIIHGNDAATELLSIVTKERDELKEERDFLFNKCKNLKIRCKYYKLKNKILLRKIKKENEMEKYSKLENCPGCGAHWINNIVQLNGYVTDTFHCMSQYNHEDKSVKPSVKCLQHQLKQMEAERDSEARWAKHYLNMWEKSYEKDKKVNRGFVPSNVLTNFNLGLQDELIISLKEIEDIKVKLDSEIRNKNEWKEQHDIWKEKAEKAEDEVARLHKLLPTAWTTRADPVDATKQEKPSMTRPCTKCKVQQATTMVLRKRGENPELCCDCYEEYTKEREIHSKNEWKEPLVYDGSKFDDWVVALFWGNVRETVQKHVAYLRKRAENAELSHKAAVLLMDAAKIKATKQYQLAISAEKRVDELQEENNSLRSACHTFDLQVEELQEKNNSLCSVCHISERQVEQLQEELSVVKKDLTLFKKLYIDQTKNFEENISKEEPKTPTGERFTTWLYNHIGGKFTKEIHETIKEHCIWLSHLNDLDYLAAREAKIQSENDRAERNELIVEIAKLKENS